VRNVCPKCGKRVKKDQHICLNCGHLLVSLSSDVTPIMEGPRTDIAARVPGELGHVSASANGQSGMVVSRDVV
jgi:hypothetical protein